MAATWQNLNFLDSDEMKLIKFDIDVQRQIIALGLDDFSPNAMLPNVHGGQYGASPEEWRKSVFLLACALMAAGLVSALPGREEYQAKSSEEIQTLLQNGDPKNGFDVDLVWDVIHFYGTEKLIMLLRKLDLNEWKAMQTGLSLPLGKALVELNVVHL